MNKETIRIIIADDHRIYRNAVKEAVQCRQDYTVICFCENGAQAVSAVNEMKPDLVMMDINMNPLDGIEATRKIKELHPDVKVIGFSIETGVITVDKMLKAGADGYLTKTTSKDEMLLAIAEVLNGHQYICNEIRRYL